MDWVHYPSGRRMGPLSGRIQCPTQGTLLIQDGEGCCITEMFRYIILPSSGDCGCSWIEKEFQGPITSQSDPDLWLSSVVPLWTYAVPNILWGVFASRPCYLLNGVVRNRCLTAFRVIVYSLVRCCNWLLQYPIRFNHGQPSQFTEHSFICVGWQLSTQGVCCWVLITQIWLFVCLFIFVIAFVLSTGIFIAFHVDVTVIWIDVIKILSGSEYTSSFSDTMCLVIRFSLLYCCCNCRTYTSCAVSKCLTVWCCQSLIILCIVTR